MVNLYTQNILDDAISKRKRLTSIFWALLLGLIIINITIFLLKQYFIEWGQSSALYFVLNVIISLIMLNLLLIYYGIPYRLCKNYTKILIAVCTGKANKYESIFIGMEEEPINRNGITFYNMMFHEGFDIKGRDKIARVMLDTQCEMPTFEMGDKVSYKICAGIMIAYDIIEKMAMDKETLECTFKSLNHKIGMEVHVENETDNIGMEVHAEIETDDEPLSQENAEWRKDN